MTRLEDALSTAHVMSFSYRRHGQAGYEDCAACCLTGKMFVGAIIVTEAGGVVIDPTGVPLDLMCRRVLAGTPQIAAQMAAILKERKCGSKEPAPPS